MKAASRDRRLKYWDSVLLDHVAAGTLLYETGPRWKEFEKLDLFKSIFKSTIVFDGA